MHRPLLETFKVHLDQYHDDGAVTKREYTLADVMKLMNSVPGTLGRHTIEKFVAVKNGFNPVFKLPKGARLISAAFHPEREVAVGEEERTLSLGTEDHPELIGVGGFSEPFAETPDSSAEAEEEQEIGFSVDLPKGQTEMVHVILQYEQFNAWPHTDEDEPKVTGLEEQARKDAANGKTANGDKPAPATGGPVNAPSPTPAATANAPRPLTPNQPQPTAPSAGS